MLYAARCSSFHAAIPHESKIIRNRYNFSFPGDGMISLVTFHSIPEHDDLLNRHEVLKLKCHEKIKISLH